MRENGRQQISYDHTALQALPGFPLLSGLKRGVVDREPALEHCRVLRTVQLSTMLSLGTVGAFLSKVERCAGGFPRSSAVIATRAQARGPKRG